MRVPSLFLVMGHFFPKHQCWSAAGHRLPEPAPPEPGLPVCHGASTAPGGRPAQRGQAGGGPPGSAVSHQSLPGKAHPPAGSTSVTEGAPTDVSWNQAPLRAREPGGANTKYARSGRAGTDRLSPLEHVLAACGSCPVNSSCLFHKLTRKTGGQGKAVLAGVSRGLLITRREQ